MLGADAALHRKHRRNPRLHAAHVRPGFLIVMELCGLSSCGPERSTPTVRVGPQTAGGTRNSEAVGGDWNPTSHFLTVLLWASLCTVVPSPVKRAQHLMGALRMRWHGACQAPATGPMGSKQCSVLNMINFFFILLVIQSYRWMFELRHKIKQTSNSGTFYSRATDLLLCLKG